MTVPEIVKGQESPPASTNTLNDNYNKDNNNFNYNSRQMILLFFLAMVTMLFAGFTSAYIIRMSAEDFKSIKMPNILWFNTVILIFTSLTFELSKIFYKNLRINIAKICIVITFLGGAIFIAGQVFAYNALQKQGIFLSSNPHSSFLYVLCGIHLMHFLAGAIWLFYVVIKSVTNSYVLLHSDILKLNSIYWHYFTIVWIYLIYLLFMFKIN